MLAVVGKHFAVLRCTVKSNSVLIGNQTVMPSVDYENRTGVRADDCKIVESIPDEKTGNKEFRCE